MEVEGKEEGGEGKEGVRKNLNKSFLNWTSCEHFPGKGKELAYTPSVPGALPLPTCSVEASQLLSEMDAYDYIL